MVDYRFDMVVCSNAREIKEGLFKVLETYKDIFPENKESLILLKPNLNSNMNALTGNTTDLRILSTVIAFLKEQEYTRILIGEGTNSGFYRNNISVISRLAVDRLADYFNIQVKDLNVSESYEIPFVKGATAGVAKEVLDAEMVINLPKLKTHFENGMSVCLKNVMGCLVGQENKKKVHDNLPENILKLNEAVVPHLHIIDAVIGMEGLGPTKGVPVRLDRILVGTDPYLLDMICARMAVFDHKKVRTLKLAEEKGLLTKDHFDYIENLNLKNSQKPFLPPKGGPLATFIHDPRRQKFFLKIRNTKFFSYLAATDWFAKLLFITNLRQDVFLSEEMRCEFIGINEARCTGCGICRDVCPLGLYLPDALKQENLCIKCMYCYSTCPENAVTFKGEFGFFNEQLRQYDKIIRNIYAQK